VRGPGGGGGKTRTLIIGGKKRITRNLMEGDDLARLKVNVGET